MRKTLSILLLTILLSSCSSDNDSSQLTSQPEHLSLTIMNYNYDLSQVVIIINDKYTELVRLCSPINITVRKGDVVKLCGQPNIIGAGIRAVITNEDTNTVIQDVPLTVSSTILSKTLEFHSCYSNGKTGLINPPLWNDLNGNTSITVN